MNTLDQQIAAIMDGATPLEWQATIAHLSRIGYAIREAAFKAECLATGREYVRFGSDAEHVERGAWQVVKSLTFNREKCRSTERRLLRLCNRLHRTWYKLAQEQDEEACRAILFCGDGSTLLEGRDEALQIALVVAGLPATATARKASREAAASKVYPVSNQRTAENLVWLN